MPTWFSEEQIAEMKEKYRFADGEMYNKKTGRKLKKYDWRCRYNDDGGVMWKINGRNVYDNWLKWAW